MLRSFLVGSFYGVCALATLTSCGQSTGAGTAAFETVVATVNPAVSGFASDVAKWVDSTNAKATPCVAGSTPQEVADSVSYTVTSTAYPVPNTGSATSSTSTTSATSSPVPTSNLLITDIEVTLTPYNPSHDPALPAQFRTLPSSPGQLILAGTSGSTTGTTTTIPVTIAPIILKQFLRTASADIPSPLNCSNQGGVYSYWAVVTVTASELNTGKVATMTAPALKVDFSDYVDQ